MMTDGVARRRSPLRCEGSSSSAVLVLALLGTVLLHCQQGGARVRKDPPVIIRAEETLSEEQDDHVEALALFAQGRTLLQRGRTADGERQRELLAEALRRFQRAWRFDPELVSIVNDIAPLVSTLERLFEATRYLVVAAQQEEMPAEWLERIAAELAEADDFHREDRNRALGLYRKLKQLQGDAVSAKTEFQIGRLALAAGKFETAAQAFAAVQEALEQRGGARISPGTRKRLMRHPETVYAVFGESYLRSGQLDKAEEAFRRANEGKPQPATLAFRLALVEKERGNRARALELLQQYFDAQTTSAGLAPYLLLTELIDPPSAGENEAEREEGVGGTRTGVEARKPSDALLDKLGQLAQADPNNPLLGYYLAAALRRVENWGEAEALYQKLLKQEPTVDGHQGLVDIYYRQRKIEQLLGQLAAVVSKVGTLLPLAGAVDQIVQDGQVLDRMSEYAEKIAGTADQRLPDGARLGLALLFAEAGRYDAAMSLFDQSLEKPIPAAGETATELALTLFRSDQPKRAAFVFQRILDHKLLPDQSAEIYYYLAGAWALAEEFEKGLAAAREAGRREPNSPRMLAREAWVLFQAKRLQEARGTYLEVLEQFDGDHTTLENRNIMRDLRLVLSAIDVELKDNDAAQEWLLQVLDEFPEDIAAFNDLGYLWTDQGKHLNRALRMVRAAVEAEPDNAAYLDSLGWALYRLGRFEEAVEPLEKAAAARESDGTILDHLGDVYLKTNQLAKAIEMWQQATDAYKEQGNPRRLQAIEAKIKQHSK